MGGDGTEAKQQGVQNLRSVLRRGNSQCGRPEAGLRRACREQRGGCWLEHPRQGTAGHGWQGRGGGRRERAVARWPVLRTGLFL